MCLEDAFALTLALRRLPFVVARLHDKFLKKFPLTCVRCTQLASASALATSWAIHTAQNMHPDRWTICEKCRGGHGACTSLVVLPLSMHRNLRRGRFRDLHFPRRCYCLRLPAPDQLSRNLSGFAFMTCTVPTIDGCHCDGVRGHLSKQGVMSAPGR